MDRSKMAITTLLFASIFTFNGIRSQQVIDALGAVSPDCLLPKEAGPCRGAFPRFYYDHTVGECQEFIWGGCDGNENKFETLEECKSYCKPGVCKSLDDCKLDCRDGFKTDSNGCLVCKCKTRRVHHSPTDQLAPCPLMACARTCPRGYLLDDRSCPTCDCIQPSTSCANRVMCSMYCEHGFMLDQGGCPRCACADAPPRCTEVACNLYCPMGRFKTDENGCSLCECEDKPKDPCQDKICDVEEMCEIDDKTSPPTAQCVRGRRWCDERVSCMMFCEHGFATDQYGCSVCSCRNSSTSSCPEVSTPCKNRCRFGYAYSPEGCRTCVCLQDGCQGKKCAGEEEVCAAYSHNSWCPLCPLTPRCIPATSVKRMHVSLDYTGEKDLAELNMDELKKQLTEQFSKLSDLDDGQIEVTEVTQLDASGHLKVIIHYRSGDNLVWTYEQLVAKLQTDQAPASIHIAGVIFLPTVDSLEVVYYNGAVDHDILDELTSSYEAVVIVIAVVLGVLVAIITLIIITVACRKRKARDYAYQNSIYQPVTTKPERA